MFMGNPYLLRERGRHTITTVGDAQILDNALLMDGTGDYLTAPTSTDFDIGGGDFVIDFFVRIDDIFEDFYAMEREEDAFNRWSIRYDGIEEEWNLLAVETSVIVSGLYPDTGMSSNTWYHMAFVHSGNDYICYRDGVKKGSNHTDADNLPDLSAVLTIGDDADSPGRMTDIRIRKGTDGGWTGATITPPARGASFADDDTVLLLECIGADTSTTFVDSAFK